MRKSKKLWISIGAAVAAIAAAVAAVFLLWPQEKEEVLAPAEDTYIFSAPGLYIYDHDPNMQIDGVLDEDVWQNKKWYHNTYADNVNGKLPAYDVTAFTTEYGVYIGSKVTDDNVYNDGEMTFNKNTKWSFTVYAPNVGEKIPLTSMQSLLFFVDINGYVYSRFPFMQARATVDGQLNSEQTKGASLEVFIPWELLPSVDLSKGVPTQVGLHSYYCALMDEEITENTVDFATQGGQLTNMAYFDSRGYTNADASSAVLGDSAYGFAKSPNWDLSREAEGIVATSVGESHHKIYFKEHYGENFIVETTIVPNRTQNNDPFPKAGIYFMTKDMYMHTVFLDMMESGLVDSVNGTRNFGHYRLVTLNNTNDIGWDQKSLSQFDRVNPNAKKQEGVKLTVAKLGPKLFYFLDDQFVTAEEYDFLDTAVYPGFYSLAADVVYKDYSCQILEKDQLLSKLNDLGVYYVEPQLTSAGGSMTCSAITAKRGEKYEIALVSKSGYTVSSIMINDKECIQELSKTAKNGVVTIQCQKENQQIKIAFEKKDMAKLQGYINCGEQSVGADIVLVGKTDPLLRYETAATEKKGFSLSLPDGTYELRAVSDGYQAVIQQITVSGDAEMHFETKDSCFTSSIDVNGTRVFSNWDNWDMTKESAGKVTSSFAMDGRGKVLYFDETAKNFVAQTTVRYTTSFRDGVDYQPDLFGGFMFHDGRNSGWVSANRSGFAAAAPEWVFYQDLSTYHVLTKPDKIPVQFTVVKYENDVYLYFDGKLIKQMAWSELIPNVDPNSTMAVGLTLWTDKTSDIEFSGYSLKTSDEEVLQYLKTHPKADRPLQANPMFADSVVIQDRTLSSLLSKWKVSKDKVTATNEARNYPLFFSAHSNTALLEATISYTTKMEEGKKYQPDLMGGFVFHDGTNTGWILAVNRGININWTFEQNLLAEEDAVLLETTQKPVKLTVALKDDYFYVFLNDQYAYRARTSQVVPNVASKAELAMGLFMWADYEADIEFSDISVSTDVKVVDEYLATNKN